METEPNPWDDPPPDAGPGVEADVLGLPVQAVQVRIVGAPRAYGYLWRPLDGSLLAVGDWVELPGNAVSPDGCKGRVEAFGRGGYAGELKEVLGRLDKPDIWLVQMEAVRDRVAANRVYRAAQAADGMTPGRLAALRTAGTEALRKAGRL